MNKLLLASALMSLALVTSPAARAASATGTFEVQINLTTACTLTPPAGPVTFDYTSLQSGAQGLTANGTFSVQCTQNLPYTLALDRVAPDTATGTTYSYTDATTALGYTLTLSAAGGSGNGAAQSYSISGSMAGGQGGQCGTAPAQNTAGAPATVCTNAGGARTRTITLVY